MNWHVYRFEDGYHMYRLGRLPVYVVKELEVQHGKCVQHEKRKV